MVETFTKRVWNSGTQKTEPARENMVLFALRKLILLTRMHSHPVGLDVWYLVGPFIYFHTSCVRTAKALARLRRLTWAFADRLCDKYHNLMSWLNYSCGIVTCLEILTEWQSVYSGSTLLSQCCLSEYNSNMLFLSTNHQAFTSTIRPSYVCMTLCEYMFCIKF